MATWARQRKRSMELSPLFDYIDRAGIFNLAGIARRLRMTRQQLWDIKYGRVPAPDGFVEIVCALLEQMLRDLEAMRGNPATAPAPRRARRSA